MANQRTEVADVIVEFRAEFAGRNAEAIEAVKSQGLAVDSVVDDDDGIVTGTIPTDRLEVLQNLSCVADVRVVDTYIGERPADPA